MYSKERLAEIVAYARNASLRANDRVARAVSSQRRADRARDEADAATRRVTRPPGSREEAAAPEVAGAGDA